MNYQVQVGQGPLPVRGQWMPWENATSVAEVSGLALNKWMRESGYQMRGAPVPEMTVNVFVVPPAVERHANGEPTTAILTTYKVTPNP
jgi:hypothetical protein